MKVERIGLDRIEHFIKPTMPRVVTIPVEKDGKHFVIYVSILPFMEEGVLDKELQDVAKEIVDKLEAKPKQLHPFFENSL